jgi:hypothetical protein
VNGEHLHAEAACGFDGSRPCLECRAAIEKTLSLWTKQRARFPDLLRHKVGARFLKNEIWPRSFSTSSSASVFVGIQCDDDFSAAFVIPTKSRIP